MGLHRTTKVIAVQLTVDILQNTLSHRPMISPKVIFGGTINPTKSSAFLRITDSPLPHAIMVVTIIMPRRKRPPSWPRDGVSSGDDQEHPSNSDVAAPPSAPTLRVALVLPSWDEYIFFMPSTYESESFIPTVEDFAGEEVDFVLFPEEYVRLSHDKPSMEALKKLASDLDAPLLMGAASRVGDGAQTLLRLDPNGSDPVQIYMKHAIAYESAFDKADWNPYDMLRTFELSGVKVGATICHDCYLGSLQRYLVKNGGAQLWLNPGDYSVNGTKWSSMLRLRAVENRIFAICTLHADIEARSKTHPFAFSPDGNELYARRAGSTDNVPISECTESDSVYIVELDMSAVGKPLNWSNIPRASKPRTLNKNPKQPVRVSLKDGRLAMYATGRWHNNIGKRCIQTEYGGVYVDVVYNKEILDAAACFDICYRAHELNCRPIIWNHWNWLPTESDRLANLMLGRAIECCAPIVISDDKAGIHELVELANEYKFPVRRPVDASEVIVDVKRAWGLPNMLNIVTKYLHHTDPQTVFDRYHNLAQTTP